MEPSREWDPETEWLIEWFRTAQLPSRPFDLSPGIRVMEPEGFRLALLTDIAAGPSGLRARMSSLQDALRGFQEAPGRPR